MKPAKTLPPADDKEACLKFFKYMEDICGKAETELHDEEWDESRQLAKNYLAVETN